MDGLVQDCSNPSALAMELLQYCPKPSRCCCPSKGPDHNAGMGLLRTGIINGRLHVYRLTSLYGLH